MCGRISQDTSPLELARQLLPASALAALADFLPHYNLCPSQDIAAVLANPRAEGNLLKMLRWGLIPSWSRDQAAGARMFNARAETIGEKPAFLAAFKARRCVIPVDGFFEWQKKGKGKQPFYFCRRDRAALALAGLWERWESPAGQRIETCSIVTTSAGAVMKPIHHRMPVILGLGDCERWLDRHEADLDRLRALLRPGGDAALVAVPVGPQVNNPRNDGPEIIAEVTPDTTTQLDLFRKAD